MDSLCSVHYKRWRQHGMVFADIPIGSCNHGLSLIVRRKILQAKPGYKYCQHCKRYKKAEKFYEIKLCMCKLCYKDAELKRRHGINNKIYNQLLKKQKGKCALCGTKDTGSKNNFFDVDHNHQTNKIRGLLCTVCNTAVGKIEKRKISIIRLTKYLKR